MRKTSKIKPIQRKACSKRISLNGTRQRAAGRSSYLICVYCHKRMKSADYAFMDAIAKQLHLRFSHDEWNAAKQENILWYRISHKYDLTQVMSEIRLAFTDKSEIWALCPQIYDGYHHGATKNMPLGYVQWQGNGAGDKSALRHKRNVAQRNKAKEFAKTGIVDNYLFLRHVYNCATFPQLPEKTVLQLLEEMSIDTTGCPLPIHWQESAAQYLEMLQSWDNLESRHSRYIASQVAQFERLSFDNPDNEEYRQQYEKWTNVQLRLNDWNERKGIADTELGQFLQAKGTNFVAQSGIASAPFDTAYAKRIANDTNIDVNSPCKIKPVAIGNAMQILPSSYEFIPIMAIVGYNAICPYETFSGWLNPAASAPIWSNNGSGI